MVDGSCLFILALSESLEPAVQDPPAMIGYCKRSISKPRYTRTIVRKVALLSTPVSPRLTFDRNDMNSQLSKLS